MLHEFIIFIHRLRVIFFLLIVVSFLSILGANPVNVSQFIGGKLGRAVGMSVSIPDNPFNKLALQLKEKEDELNAREKELSAREADLNEQRANASPWLIGLYAGIAILFFLIIINYYLDYRRRRLSAASNKRP